jgi:hypothetical protein
MTARQLAVILAVRALRRARSSWRERDHGKSGQKAFTDQTPSMGFDKLVRLGRGCFRSVSHKSSHPDPDLIRIGAD